MATPLQQQPTASSPNSAAVDVDGIHYLAEGFSALADATRLRMIHLLMTRGEMCVCEFMPALDLTQSNVSFHLKALKYAGFITSRKEGRWMLYRLNREAFEHFQNEFKGVFDVGSWPEEVAPELRDEAIRRRLTCQQESSGLLRATQGDNDNANE